MVMIKQYLLMVNSGYTNARNLVSNSGVVAADTTGGGTARSGTQAARYGLVKQLFAYGTGISIQM